MELNNEKREELEKFFKEGTESTERPVNKVFDLAEYFENNERDTTDDSIWIETETEEGNKRTPLGNGLFDVGKNPKLEGSVAIIENSQGEKVADVIEDTYEEDSRGNEHAYIYVEAAQGKLNRIDEDYLIGLYGGYKRCEGRDFGSALSGIEFEFDGQGTIVNINVDNDEENCSQTLADFKACDVMKALKYEYYHNKYQPNVSKEVFFKILSKTDMKGINFEKLAKMFNKLMGYEAIQPKTPEKPVVVAQQPKKSLLSRIMGRFGKSRG